MESLDSMGDKNCEWPVTWIFGIAPVRCCGCSRDPLTCMYALANSPLAPARDARFVRGCAVPRHSRTKERVLIVDDLLATGGTARATTDLVKKLGGDVHGLAFLIELVALDGRKKLEGERLHTVLKY